MPTEDPAVPIVCTEGETERRVPWSGVAAARSRHTEGTRGGEAVAEVDPGVKARLAALVAEDIGLFEEG